MEITFYGGAGGVTGSKHLLTTNQSRLLLDCGTFQGLSDVRERNRSLPFAPESVDHVILSHAHIDHCGMLPLLVKRGFTGSIFATPATRDVAQHMLSDAAAIERQDTDYRRRHHLGSPDDREPLFTQADVAATMQHFVEVPYVRDRNVWQPVADGVSLKLYDAGHILGSSVAVLEVREGAATRTLAYSGDLGPRGVPLLYDPEIPAESVEVLLLESTYGARVHEPKQQALDRLAATIQTVVKRRGKIIIPAFSLGRTQAIVYLLHQLTDSGRIPRVPVFVDSPLAADITQVFMEHEHDYDTETWLDFSGADHTPLEFRNLQYTRSVDESKALNSLPGPYIVISASGMMTAGRVVHHLRHSISDKRNAVFITGYQAEGTLGRRLLEGATNVELYGDRFDVRAEMYVFNEFSAHADQQQLIEYASALRGMRHVVLVHGEPQQADRLLGALRAARPAWRIDRPDEGDTIALG